MSVSAVCGQVVATGAETYTTTIPAGATAPAITAISIRTITVTAAAGRNIYTTTVAPHIQHY